jgi:chaperonin cofactor prefoldin
MATLYELNEDFLALLDMASDEDETAFNDTLEGILGTIDIKMDDYAAVMTHIESDIALHKAEIDRLSVRKKSLENNLKRMKERLYESMIATDRRKVQTELHTFSIVKNGGKLPVIIDGDVPDNFCRKTPDNDKIRLALETGNALTFAHYGERGEHLAIK